MIVNLRCGSLHACTFAKPAIHLFIKLPNEYLRSFLVYKANIF